MTDKQKDALSKLLNGPAYLPVGSFTPLRNAGLVTKAEGGTGAGRGMVYSTVTDKGRAALSLA